MPMRWDPLVARAMARALSKTLAGARVRALLLDGERRRVVLHLRESTLVAEMHPTTGWITLHPAADPPPEARALPARVHRIEAISDERILVIELRRIRGTSGGVRIQLDFTGNRWNATVLDLATQQVRHVLVPRASEGLRASEGPRGQPRTPRAGVPGGPHLDETTFAAAFQPKRAEHPRATEGNVGRALAQIGWSSSLNLPALQGPDGWEWWSTAARGEGEGGWSVGEGKRAFAYPYPIPGALCKPAPSILEAVAALREVATGSEPEGHEVSPALLAAGAAWIEKLDRQRRALIREWEGSPDPAPIRARGDLLLARFREVPAGASRVILEGFDGVSVELTLDPALPVHRNADRIYQRAGRIERALDQLPGRIDAAERAVRAAQAIVLAVRSGASPPAALEHVLPDALQPRGPDAGGGGARSGQGPKPRSGRGAPDGAEGAPLPYRRFRTSGGIEVRVGKGARHNDALTFRHAAPDDVWMHVREAPGAHVILRWNRAQDPPARDLEEAAALAALHSDARHAGLVPVDWTRRKHVRKPRKSAPGAVIPDRVRTVFATPSPALTEQLRWRVDPWPDGGL